MFAAFSLQHHNYEENAIWSEFLINACMRSFQIEKRLTQRLANTKLQMVRYMLNLRVKTIFLHRNRPTDPNSETRAHLFTSFLNTMKWKQICSIFAGVIRFALHSTNHFMCLWLFSSLRFLIIVVIFIESNEFSISFSLFRGFFFIDLENVWVFEVRTALSDIDRLKRVIVFGEVILTASRKKKPHNHIEALLSKTHMNIWAFAIWNFIWIERMFKHYRD